MNDMRLFNVVGIDDLEGTTFARCTTYEKAVIAQDKLEKEGFEGLLDIIQDEIPIDVIEIGGKLIELGDSGLDIEDDGFGLDLE